MTCLICLEPAVGRWTPPQIKTENGDFIRPSHSCTHIVCETCMEAYVSAKIIDMRVNDLRCPAPDCKTKLYDCDINYLLGDTMPEILSAYRSLKKTTHRERMTELVKSYSLQELCELAQARVKVCPCCCMLLQRSAGCDSFFCVCGHQFTYSDAPDLVPARRLRLMNIFKHTHQYLHADSLQGVRRALRVQHLLGIDEREAAQLAELALRGDEHARAAIRTARQHKDAPGDFVSSQDFIF
ncbi:hypothetical protein EBU99_14275 [bacterium]|nr:hypothetical protein [bacterium]